MRRLREMLALAGLIGVFMIVIKSYAGLPATIPTHFNANGAINGWGSKSTLLGLPAIALALYVILTLVRRFPPERMSLPVPEEERERCIPIALEMLEWLKVILMWVMAATSWAVVGGAEGRTPSPILMAILPVCILGVVLLYLWRMMKG